MPDRPQGVLVRVPPRIVRVIARGKPFVPATAWPVLRTLSSARGSAPLVADPDGAPTLVLCAHPDDELGCAGTVAMLAAAGTLVTVVYATDGDGTRGSPYPPAETARRRTREARQACSVLGVHGEPEFWGLPDGALPALAAELTERLARTVARVGPARVLVPWFLDGHRDHQAVSRAVADAALPEQVEVWGFEWWTPLPANRLVDITSAWPRKQQAAAAHATAALAFDVTAQLALSRYRALSGLHGQGYGEAFVALPHRDYRALAGQALDCD
jgi:LmbE family N-acetylglucosaminyl deacetylase